MSYFYQNINIYDIILINFFLSIIYILYIYNNIYFYKKCLAEYTDDNILCGSYTLRILGDLSCVFNVFNQNIIML